MSASPRKRTNSRSSRYVRFVPKADLRTAAKREPRPSRWWANPKPRRSYGRSGRPAPRHQHRHAVPVAAIFVAEELDQIPLFQLNSDDNVSSRYDRKQQVPGGHRWCRPKRDDETEVEWVPDEAVEQRSAEARRGHRAGSEVVDDLVQAEELEVVDQECAEQHN